MEDCFQKILDAEKEKHYEQYWHKIYSKNHSVYDTKASEKERQSDLEIVAEIKANEFLQNQNPKVLEKYTFFCVFCGRLAAYENCEIFINLNEKTHKSEIEIFSTAFVLLDPQMYFLSSIIHYTTYMTINYEKENSVLKFIFDFRKETDKLFEY